MQRATVIYLSEVKAKREAEKSIGFVDKIKSVASKTGQHLQKNWKKYALGAALIGTGVAGGYALSNRKPKVIPPKEISTSSKSDNTNYYHKADELSTGEPPVKEVTPVKPLTKEVAPVKPLTKEVAPVKPPVKPSTPKKPMISSYSVAFNKPTEKIIDRSLAKNQQTTGDHSTDYGA